MGATGMPPMSGLTQSMKALINAGDFEFGGFKARVLFTFNTARWRASVAEHSAVDRRRERQSNDLLRNRRLEQRGTKLSSQIAPLCATSVFSVSPWLVLAVN
jgi:hypothetical protein